MLSVLYVPFYNKKLQRRTILNIFYSFVKKKKEEEEEEERKCKINYSKRILFIILDNSCIRLCIE